MKNQITPDLVDWMQHEWHCEVKKTSERWSKWQPPIWKYGAAPLDMMEVIDQEPVFTLKFAESDLAHMIQVLHTHGQEQHMIHRHPAVQEAWMNWKTLMMLMRDNSD